MRSAALGGTAACLLSMLPVVLAAQTVDGDAKAALAASFDRRLKDIEKTAKTDIAAEIAARAAEMGVKLSVDDLFTRFYNRALLALANEKCFIANPPGPECPGAAQQLKSLEDTFVADTGISMADFKAGRVSPPVQVQPTPWPFPPSRFSPNYCSCTVAVASLARWMDPSWALECGGHAGHGVCSNNVDTRIHSPGIGAMTGKITAGMSGAGQQRTFNCPDDHRSCFQGPAGDGEWGNVCSCDTLHSQLWNPGGAFYGGSLSHNVLVNQVSFANLNTDGSCNGQSISVSERIVEHDPVCCDDPMGTLTAGATAQTGTHVFDVASSAQNCNGGSQSGLPPNCGSFGATLRLTVTCQVKTDGAGSCYGRCGQTFADASCQCDSACFQYGDCCPDYCSSCPGPHPINTLCNNN